MRELDLRESLELLMKYSIPVAESQFVDSEEKLERISGLIRYPAVVKPNTSFHKTEIGVFKNLKSFDEVKSAFRKIGGSVAIQRMVDGYEIFLGAKKDEGFRHVVAVGSGGVFAELFNDISFRLIPLSRADFHEMLEETKLSKISNGFRGFSFDPDELFRIVGNFEKLVTNENVVEADINPLMADKDEIVAVDARIILD